MKTARVGAFQGGFARSEVWNLSEPTPLEGDKSALERFSSFLWLNEPWECDPVFFHYSVFSEMSVWCAESKMTQKKEIYWSLNFLSFSCIFRQALCGSVSVTAALRGANNYSYWWVAVRSKTQPTPLSPGSVRGKQIPVVWHLLRVKDIAMCMFFILTVAAVKKNYESVSSGWQGTAECGLNWMGFWQHCPPDGVFMCVSPTRIHTYISKKMHLFILEIASRESQNGWAFRYEGGARDWNSNNTRAPTHARARTRSHACSHRSCHLGCAQCRAKVSFMLFV